MSTKADTTAEAIRRRAEHVCRSAPPLTSTQLAKLGLILRGGCHVPGR